MNHEGTRGLFYPLSFIPHPSSLIPSFGAGVRLVVAILESLGSHMGVYLRGRQAAVAQKLLDAANIRAAIEQMRREAVPQRMRTRARVQSDPGEIFFE